MTQVKVKWDADQREVPGCGVLSRGDVRSMPEHLAKSFIYQGLAVPHKPKQQEKAK